MREFPAQEIGRIFCEVLEKQVFMFPDPLEAEEYRAGDGRLMICGMTFGGTDAGQLLLIAPEGMARELAANFLGVEAGDPIVEESFRDSLKEILNVTCGHMLTALYGVEAMFDLSVPKLSGIFGGDAEVLAKDPDCLAFAVDGHHALLQVKFFSGSGRLSNPGVIDAAG